MKLLLVEDDPKVGRLLVRVLEEEGYAVEWCCSGDEARARTRATAGAPFDLLLLDWMLPDGDGLAVCRDLRERGAELPILMLTARAETRERVLGLESGADDYLVKPFEIDELLARLRALLRRSRKSGRLRLGPLELDPLARKAWLDGAPLPLASRELALLLHLGRHAGRAVSRAELLAEVWETHFDPGTNVVEVHVSRLRDKLGAHAGLVATVRGVGYLLRVDEAP